jgi:alpha-mannosidase
MAQSDLIANTAGLSMAAIQGAVMPDKVTDRIEATNSALLFYTEHTVGYHASVTEPFHKYTMEQRAIKESYAWEARPQGQNAG